MNIAPNQRITRVCAPVIALFALTAALAGCGGKPNLVGKWEPTITIQADGKGTNPLAGMNLTKEFRADGTETTTTYIGRDLLVITGTYEIKGDTLTEIGKTKSLNREPPVPIDAVNPINGLSNIATSKFTFDGDSFTQTVEAGGVSVKQKFDHPSQ